MTDQTHDARSVILAAIEEHFRDIQKSGGMPLLFSDEMEPLAKRIDEALFGAADSAHPTPWRQGQNVAENLYDADQALHGDRPGRPVGVMRTPALAQRVTEAINGIEKARADLAELEEEVQRLGVVWRQRALGRLETENHVLLVLSRIADLVATEAHNDPSWQATRQATWARQLAEVERRAKIAYMKSETAMVSRDPEDIDSGRSRGSMKRVHVDYNNPEGIGTLDEPVDVGEIVITYDGEGNECEGEVTKIYDSRRAGEPRAVDLVCVKLDWLTWTEVDGL